eukprot:g6158.t1
MPVEVLIYVFCYLFVFLFIFLLSACARCCQQKSSEENYVDPTAYGSVPGYGAVPGQQAGWQPPPWQQAGFNQQQYQGQQPTHVTGLGMQQPGVAPASAPGMSSEADSSGMYGRTSWGTPGQYEHYLRNFEQVSYEVPPAVLLVSVHRVTPRQYENCWRNFESERIGCPPNSEVSWVMKEATEDPQEQVLAKFIDPEDVCEMLQQTTRYGLDIKSFYQQRIDKYGLQGTAEEFSKSKSGKYMCLDDDATSADPFLHPAMVFWLRHRRPRLFLQLPVWDIAHKADGSVDYEQCRLMEIQELSVHAIRLNAQQKPQQCARWLAAIADLEERQKKDDFTPEWRAFTMATSRTKL